MGAEIDNPTTTVVPDDAAMEASQNVRLSDAVGIGCADFSLSRQTDAYARTCRPAKWIDEVLSETGRIRSGMHVSQDGTG